MAIEDKDDTKLWNATFHKPRQTMPHDFLLGLDKIRSQQNAPKFSSTWNETDRRRNSTDKNCKKGMQEKGYKGGEHQTRRIIIAGTNTRPPWYHDETEQSHPSLATRYPRKQMKPTNQQQGEAKAWKVACELRFGNNKLLIKKLDTVPQKYAAQTNTI